jgi:hypothetical protein
MKVRLDLESLSCDLTQVDLVELTLLHDALATYIEALFPEIAEALSEGTTLDEALEKVDENDAFKIRTVIERLYDKLERPLSILEQEAELLGEVESDRVRIVLESAEEAQAFHEAAEALRSQVGRALEASDLPYPDAESLLAEFATWFDPDDIPEYPYYIEMDVADARIVAQLAERVQAHDPSPQMAQLLAIMQAASTVTEEDSGEE